MKGIDVSHWNSLPFNAATAAAYKEADFCIVKATDGKSYSYAKTFFPKAMGMVLKDGKLGGAYHYATGAGTATQEADYFISIVKPYIGKIILCLDWESQNNKVWGNKTWCKTFIDRVKAKTGVTCFLYTGMDGIKQNTSLANYVPLWFAAYPKNEASWTVPAFPKRYSLAPWTAYTIWQFSAGGGVDRNYTKLTKTKWIAMAKGSTTAPAADPVATKKSVAEIAQEVIDGKWGAGEDRKKKLTAAGYNYAAVQAKVNEMLSGKSYDKSLSGTYMVTAKAGLNMRAKAGMGNQIVTVLNYCAKVTNSGYYATAANVKWLYVTYGKYSGFCSSQYLKKV